MRRVMSVWQGRMLVVCLHFSQQQQHNYSNILILCIKKKDGFIGTYPTEDQVRLQGKEHTTEYVYGRKFNGIAHCATCSVHAYGLTASAVLLA